jgi:hypothetical protein
MFLPDGVVPSPKTPTPTPALLQKLVTLTKAQYMPHEFDTLLIIFRFPRLGPPINSTTYDSFRVEIEKRV